ncbi:MAG: DUF2628 domain-containing protein [Rhizobiaceae bacterium]
MAVFTVYLKPEGTIADPADGFRLVKDGNSPLALIFPPVWLVWHRLWLALLAYLAVTMAIILLAVWQPGAAIAYLSALPGFYLLLEGSELVRGKIERQGWQYAGIVQGDTREEAEIRYLAESGDTVLKSKKIDPSRKVISRPAFHSPSATAGLFPE